MNPTNKIQILPSIEYFNQLISTPRNRACRTSTSTSSSSSSSNMNTFTTTSTTLLLVTTSSTFDGKEEIQWLQEVLSHQPPPPYNKI